LWKEILESKYGRWRNLKAKERLVRIDFGGRIWRSYENQRNGEVNLMII